MVKSKKRTKSLHPSRDAGSSPSAHTEDGGHKEKIKIEEKAKIVAAVSGAELLQFFAALYVL